METDEYLEPFYESIVKKSIDKGIITRKEWDERFSDFKDEYGHSFVHYLNCILNKIDLFLTTCKIMIDNRQELKKRFGVEIILPEEFVERNGQDF